MSAAGSRHIRPTDSIDGFLPGWALRRHSVRWGAAAFFSSQVFGSGIASRELH